MNNYVVIAHNNGVDKLTPLLHDLKTHGTHGWKICVVDTGSTDDRSLGYLEYLDKYEDIKILRRHGGYLSGAWNTAYENLLDARQYVFIHDSMRVVNPNFLPNFVSLFENNNLGAAAYAAFQFPSWDCQEQVDWLSNYLDMSVHPPHGIFGSCFLTSREVLRDLDSKGLMGIIESNKVQCMAMERGWSIAFKQAGYDVKFLVDNFLSLFSGDCGTGLLKNFYGRS
jgi:glycosyltransferase involved in cell wall biosynthesis